MPKNEVNIIFGIISLTEENTQIEENVKKEASSLFHSAFMQIRPFSGEEAGKMKES